MANSTPWIVSGRLVKLPAILAVALALLLLPAMAHANYSSTILSGSVDVNCPFIILLSANAPFYVQPDEVQLTYNVFTTGACYNSSMMPTNMPYLSGSLVLSNTITSNVYYSQSITVNGPITNTPTIGTIVFASNVPHIPTSSSGTIGAALSLSYQSNFSSPGTTTFTVFSPANIVAGNITVSPNPSTPGTTLTISQNVINTGGLTALNLTLYTTINGPFGYFVSFNQTILPNTLAPGSEIYSFSQIGLTQQLGTYTITQNLTYQSSYTYNSVTTTTNILISNNATGNYIVIPQHTSGGGGGGGGGGGAGGPQPPPVGLPAPPAGVAQVEFQQLPLITTLFKGNSIISIIGVHNAGNVSAWTNITLPTLSYGTLSLSSNAIFLTKGQTELVYLLFSANENATPGMNVASLNVIVTPVGGKPTMGIIFTELNIMPVQLTPSVQYTASVTNYSHGILAQVRVINPTDSPIYGSYVYVRLPASSVPNASDIQISGPGGNVTLINGDYVLSWFIPILPARESTVFTYTVSNATNIQTYFNAQVAFTMPSNSTQGRIKVFDINVPSFYVNMTENITVSLIYTGSNATNVTVDLITPSFITAMQPQLTYRVIPNEVIVAKFTILPVSASGTRLFQLIVKGAGQPNQTYSIPVVILASGIQPPSISIPSQLNAAQLRAWLEYAAILLLIILILIYIFRRAYRRLGGARYSLVRAERLRQIRQRIKRETGGLGSIEHIFDKPEKPEEPKREGGQSG